MEYGGFGKLAYTQQDNCMKQTRLIILFWNLGVGGVQTIIRDLVMYLHDTHPNVKVYILIKHNDDSNLTKVIQKKSRATICSPTFIGNVRIINQIHFFVWVAFLYLKLSPNICLTFLDTLSIFVTGLHKLVFWKKVRVVLNEGVLTSKNNVINKHPVWFWNWSVSFFYKYADVIIVPSVACKTDLVSNFRVPERIVQVSRYWTLYKKNASERRIIDLIYVGRFEKEKNTPALIELVKLLRRTRPRILLCLVGKGREESKLRKMVTDGHLQKNIIFAGYRTDFVSYLRKSKVFVTTTENEGIPLTILDAGSQQTPCVAHRFIGSEEIIQQGKTGFLADTLPEMCLYINALLKNNSLRKEIGFQAQTFVHQRCGLSNVRTFVAYLLDV